MFYLKISSDLINHVFILKGPFYVTCQSTENTFMINNSIY